jgi:tRNAThr (cytosine32-N3)-methyltransferase
MWISNFQTSQHPLLTSTSTAGSMANEDTSPSDMALPTRPKQPKQQLTKGMEHMRSYVTIPDTPPATPDPDSGNDTYGVPSSIQPIRQPISVIKEDNLQKRSDPFQFGTRYLTDESDIFSHNAWDHVSVDPAYDSFITEQTAFQRENQVSEFDKNRFNSAPEKWWDKFYSNNETNFFKDRKWLVQEFPVLGEVTKQSYGSVTVLEVGAGAGNTAFPLLAMNSNLELKLRACDYSAKAIEIIRKQDAYVNQEGEVLRADVWDAASDELPPGLVAGSVDVVVMIFIFSALEPKQWQQAIKKIYTLLKPGGQVLFRDYGRGDLAQVRFKKGRYLEENFYVRGDGTRVYFFDEEELRQIWEGKYFQEDGGENAASNAGFEIVDLAVDRRMLVNRQRKLKMYRCWMQGRFRKPLLDDRPES